MASMHGRLPKQNAERARGAEPAMAAFQQDSCSGRLATNVAGFLLWAKVGQTRALQGPLYFFKHVANRFGWDHHHVAKCHVNGETLFARTGRLWGWRAQKRSLIGEF
jgi:hypothetical protein